MPTPTRVKGIKYGTLASYLALRTHDSDTLYFITDKGLLYRGTSIVVPVNVTTHTAHTQGTGQDAFIDTVRFQVETYGSDPEHPDTLDFTVYTRQGVEAALNVINAAISNHAANVASDTTLGHTYLSDAIDDDQSAAATHGTAATPKAVHDALARAMEYVDSQMGGLTGALVYKGTIGAADDYSNNATYAVGDYCEHSSNLYRCTTAIETPEEWTAGHWSQVDRTVAALPNTHQVGWTYEVIVAGSYAGKVCEPGDRISCITAGTTANNDHWTVVQANIDGAVTANDTLDDGLVVVGAGNKKVRKLPQGTNGHFLRQDTDGKAEWKSHEAVEHGIGYGTCVIDGAAGIVSNMVGYVRIKGALVAIKFTNDVPANATLNINGTGACHIKYANLNIVAGVINAGDTAFFVFNGTYYVLLGVDRPAAMPTSLGQLTNDIIAHATCNTSAATPQKDVTVTGYHVAAGSILAVRFANDVPASATLCINGGTPAAIHHRGAAIAVGAIRGGDTASFVYDGTNWQLLGIDRPFDTTPTSGSHSLVDSDAVYQFVENRTLYWDEM